MDPKIEMFSQLFRKVQDSKQTIQDTLQDSKMQVSIWSLYSVIWTENGNAKVFTHVYKSEVMQ